jgi:uncharacterized protein affecting Mg2+/Co2+ transport
VGRPRPVRGARPEAAAVARAAAPRYLRTMSTAVTDGIRIEVQSDFQPERSEPGESFQYTSYCLLRATHGSMQGEFRMVRDDGDAFDAGIAPFPLMIPQLVN